MIHKTRVTQTLMFAVLGLWVLSGCPRPGSSETALPLITTENPDAEADLQTAHETMQAGRIEEATQLYEHFIEQHAEDPLVPVAQFELGRLQLASDVPGAPDRAMSFFDRAASVSLPNEAFAERVRLYRGVALHMRGDHDAAVTALRSLVGKMVDPEESALLLQTLAAASIQCDDRVAALIVLDDLLQSPASETDKETARAEAVGLIEAATNEETAALYDRLQRTGSLWPMVGRAALHSAFVAGDMERVRAIADVMRERGEALEPELQAFVVRADRDGRANPNVIGVILPLSGRGREVGQRILHGVTLASGSHRGGPIPANAPQIIVRDSAGDVENAVAAVDDLVALHRAIAIIGPVGRATTEAVVQRASRLGVPVLTMSSQNPHANTAEESAEGATAFRVVHGLADEARALIQAAKKRGARRFAAVYGEHGYGRAFVTALEQQASVEGVEWVGKVGYASGTTAFGGTARALKRLRADAILIADESRQVALVAPAMAAAGMWSAFPGESAPEGTSDDAKTVTLLIPSVGLNAQLLRMANRYLQGALFARAFDAQATSENGRVFTEAFERRNGTPPDHYAAYGHDAFHLIRAATERGALTRHDVITKLRGIETPTTITLSGLSDEGVPRDGPAVLTLQGETLRLEL